MASLVSDATRDVYIRKLTRLRANTRDEGAANEIRAPLSDVRDPTRGFGGGSGGGGRTPSTTVAQPLCLRECRVLLNRKCPIIIDDFYR